LSDDGDKLVFDDVKLHDVHRLLGEPEFVKLIEQVNYTTTPTHVSKYSARLIKWRHISTQCPSIPN